MQRMLTYAEALREATEQAMTRDPSVMVMGLGVDDFRGIYGTTLGLQAKFGPKRVIDTPVAEDAMTGIAIGAALAGLRPIHVHIRMDFVLLAMNQLINIAAKYHYMVGGALQVPIVVRSIIGRSWGQGAQHSQGLHAMFMHVPGLRVVAPSTPYDAKGCLLASIRDNNPVMFVEHRMLHGQRGYVPEDPYEVPFGRARVLARGNDVTIVAVSYMVVEALRAQRLLREAGVDAEVIDPISLSPLDTETIIESVRRTGRLLVADCAWTNCGASAEIIARVLEATQGERSIMVRRVGFAPTTCPTTRNLEDLYYPDATSLARTAFALVRGPEAPFNPVAPLAPEVMEFKGPF